jgi:hypothetical protein
MDQVPFQKLPQSCFMKLNARALSIFLSKCNCLNALKSPTNNAWDAHYVDYLNAKYPANIPKKGDNKEDHEDKRDLYMIGILALLLGFSLSFNIYLWRK